MLLYIYTHTEELLVLNNNKIDILETIWKIFYNFINILFSIIKVVFTIHRYFLIIEMLGCSTLAARKVCKKHLLD